MMIYLLTIEDEILELYLDESPTHLIDDSVEDLLSPKLKGQFEQAIRNLKNGNAQN